MPIPTTKYDVSYDRLFADLTYDPATGHFHWTKPRRGRHPGRPAGYIDACGYRVVSVDGKSYFAHRLAWFWTHGVWPTENLDHANRDPADNRIENLREATHAQNAANRRWRNAGSSGYRGVRKASTGSNFQASIKAGGREMHIGTYPTKLEAALAYDEAAVVHHGAYAILNFPEARAGAAA